MNARVLLDELCRRGVRLTADGGHIDYRAPKGAMTSECLAALKEHKSEIMQLLEAEATVPGRDTTAARGTTLGAAVRGDVNPVVLMTIGARHGYPRLPIKAGISIVEGMVAWRTFTQGADASMLSLAAEAARVAWPDGLVACDLLDVEADGTSETDEVATQQTASSIPLLELPTLGDRAAATGFASRMGLDDLFDALRKLDAQLLVKAGELLLRRPEAEAGRPDPRRDIRSLRHAHRVVQVRGERTVRRRGLLSPSRLCRPEPLSRPLRAGRRRRAIPQLRRYPTMSDPTVRPPDVLGLPACHVRAPRPRHHHAELLVLDCDDPLDDVP